MKNSIKNLTQLIGIILAGIGIYGIIKQALDTSPLFLATPAVCILLGGCSWGLSYVLGASITADQDHCEKQEDEEETGAAQESDHDS